MSDTFSFRCTCGNQAKNLMTMPSGELLAKCGRCAPIRPNAFLRPGKGTVAPLDSVMLTPELATQIITDTQAVVEQRNKEREREVERRSKTSEVVSAYTAVETVREKEVSMQVFGEENLSLPAFFTSRDAKWKHIPYNALQRVFEFHGDWGTNRVSRRWYDCFMNYSFELSIPTDKFVATIAKCSQSISILGAGWSSEHASFWRKLTHCHSETISLLTILPKLQGPLENPNWLKLQFAEWVLNEIIRPSFVIRDKSLFDHLYKHFDDIRWARSTMKAEFHRIARVFTELRRFPLFLREYGYLTEEFGLTPRMIHEMMNLRRVGPTNKNEESAA